MIDLIQSFEGGKPRIEKAETLAFDLALLEEVHDADAEGERKQGVRQEECGNVQIDPAALQRRALVGGTCTGRMEEMSMKRTARGETKEPRMRSPRRICTAR